MPGLSTGAREVAVDFALGRIARISLPTLRHFAWRTQSFRRKSWQATGRNGFAPAGQKKEGDGRTPSGTFYLKQAFGYPPLVKTGLDYRQATDNDFWVDDPSSTYYNQWVDGKPLAQSFERLKRDDDLYKYGIVVEYNTEPIESGKGSAIFVHVWRGPDSSTAGCMALSEENLIKLLEWLNKMESPMIILGEDVQDGK